MLVLYLFLKLSCHNLFLLCFTDHCCKGHRKFRKLLIRGLVRYELYLFLENHMCSCLCIQEAKSGQVAGEATKVMLYCQL
jgi:hypothetical protein